jgi:hypothetical protein
MSHRERHGAYVDVPRYQVKLPVIDLFRAPHLPSSRV